MPRSASSRYPRLLVTAAAAALSTALSTGLLTVPTAAAPPPPSEPARQRSAPDAPVAPTVRTVRMPGVDAVAARTLPPRSLEQVVALSPAVPVSGYGAVGVTWAESGEAAGQRLLARTRTGAGWSRWDALMTEAEHGPSPGSAEAEGAVPGTNPMIVGDVDAVQVKATAVGGAPPDGLTLSVIDPGQDPAAGSTRLGAPAYPATRGAGGATPRPAIYSRAQWGADERLRSGFAGYGEVQGSFVHHTVNANDYSRAEVPAILRSIYAYHTQSQGWSDVGYNYLVDRFGRVWEGRWGGIGRPVIGAHTLDYNEKSFAMSAIGNFETAPPTRSLLRSYARLFAWKLSLHGVDANARARIGALSARAINGHRDAASTACPGRHLYARLHTIRERAAELQKAWNGRRLERSVASGPLPDLLVRDGRDTTVLAGRAGPNVRRVATVAADWSGYGWARIAGDWDRDGHDDVLAREGGRMWLLAGRGGGRFAPRVGGWGGRRDQTNIAAVGDWDGDGRPDLIARSRQGSVWLHPGRGRNGFGAAYKLRNTIGSPTVMLGVGRWNADGAPDLMTRSRAGGLRLWPGNGPGGLGDPVPIASDLRRYDRLIGVGNLDRDSHPDLVGRLEATGRLHLLPGRPLRLGAAVPVGAHPVVGTLG